MIECCNITKKYKNKVALKDVSLQLRGGVYGLIGENGAGKSTLFKLLTGQISADSGQIMIDGMLPQKGKLKIGYLPQKFDFFSNITVFESMIYIGILKGMLETEAVKEALHWLVLMNLAGEKGKKVGSLSGGMKQRLGIAQAFLGDPDYILLDEPTVGLDPKERLAFRNMVNEVGTEKTVLISTHIVEDVEAACENLLVLHEGKLLYSGTTSDFVSSIKENICTVRIPRNRLAEYSSRLDLISIKLFKDEIEIRFADRQNGMFPEGKKTEICCLEDAYFLKTGMLYKKGDIL